jgi:hypothetical protein
VFSGNGAGVDPFALEAAEWVSDATEVELTGCFAEVGGGDLAGQVVADVKQRLVRAQPDVVGREPPAKTAVGPTVLDGRRQLAGGDVRDFNFAESLQASPKIA